MQLKLLPLISNGRWSSTFKHETSKFEKKSIFPKTGKILKGENFVERVKMKPHQNRDLAFFSAASESETGTDRVQEASIVSPDWQLILFPSWLKLIGQLKQV